MNIHVVVNGLGFTPYDIGGNIYTGNVIHYIWLLYRESITWDVIKICF